MSARFEVESTFTIPSRKLFVMFGRIVEGTIRVGQRVVSAPELDAPVAAVECVLLCPKARLEYPALGFHYRDEPELSRWQSLGLRGGVIELADAGGKNVPDS